MHKVLLGICCLACCLGCSTVKSTIHKPLKATRHWYREYVNPKPEVDLTVHDDQKCGPKGFATSFVPVDMKLNLLERDFSTQDTYPEDPWFDVFLARYPWVDQITALTVHGEVLTRRATMTQVGDEDIDYGALCQEDNRNRLPRVHVLPGSSGKRMALSMPFFKDNKHKGCLVALFSFDRVVKFTPAETDLIILDSQGHALWAGQYAGIVDELAAQPWEKRLAGQVRGRAEVQGKQFFWLGRSFAGAWLVYASEIKDP